MKWREIAELFVYPVDLDSLHYIKLLSQMCVKFIMFLLFLIFGLGDIIEETNKALTNLRNDRFLRGIQLQITKGKQIIYNFNIG